MGCHFLLQGIFPTKESNLGLLHWQEESLPSEPPVINYNRKRWSSLVAQWQSLAATVHGVPKEPDTTERVNNNNGACEFHECFRQIIKAESGLGHFSNFAPPPRTEQRGCIRECPHVLEETTEPGFATSQLTGQVGPLGQGFSQCGPGHIRTVFRMQILSVPRPRPADPESRG